MSWREIAIFVPLIVLTLWLGLLSEASARHVGGIGDGAARQLPAVRWGAAKSAALVK
jgi:hypothetical protein